LKQVWTEVAPAIGGAGRCSTCGGGGRALGADAEVGRKPTTTANAGEAGKWGGGGTPSDTLGEHYQMELPQPSSSLFPCGCGSHHPR
jgi:hypothetical protein